MKRRFGDVDNEREAQRKFKNCKQSEHQTIAEFEQTLRLFYKLGWPSATKAQKDGDLKCQFEDGVLSSDLAQYL